MKDQEGGGTMLNRGKKVSIEKQQDGSFLIGLTIFGAFSDYDDAMAFLNSMEPVGI